MAIPEPELALFHHKLPRHAFYETVQLARRWTGPEALAAGLVQQTASMENLLEVATRRAAELAKLGANRKVYGKMKESIFGEEPSINSPFGAAHQLKNLDQFH